MSNEMKTALTNFGGAIFALKQGKKVARSGWNGKGMWLTHIDGDESDLKDGSKFKSLPYIAMKTVGDELVPWLASQTDVLAEDWVVLE